MRYVYDNNKLKSRLLMCDCLDEADDILRDKTLYKIIWVEEGEIELIINHERFVFSAGEVVSLSYLHHLEVKKVNGIYGTIMFNSRFFHIIEHDDEVLCNGLLFNGSLNIVSFRIPTDDDAFKLRRLKDVFSEEMNYRDSMQDEMLRLILKRALILCCRMARNKLGVRPQNSSRFEVMRKFHSLVDEHFREKKQVQDYADMLNKSPQTLANILTYYRQPSAIKIIHNRIIAEAERLLFYTSKSPKEISAALGFDEISHFSRFFKSMTGQSATEFRSNIKRSADKAIA
ncbi:MAG: helix-turn-helix domain-containing protein [Tannerellaceae bacterium]|jgi:AraC-like DNA-binding protein|nr:helix-turn-helix domain-containing protein [Tannerellaceae bacterium]